MDNNQEPQVQEPAAEKMFTQAELDEIIADFLKELSKQLIIKKVDIKYSD